MTALPPASPPPTGSERHAGLRGIIRDVLSLERGALAILVAVPLVLTLLDYYGMPWHYPEHKPRRPAMTDYTGRVIRPPLVGTHPKEMRPTDAPLANLIEDLELPGPEPVRPYVWWGICCILFLVLIPTLVARLFAGKGPRSLGLKVKGTGRDAWTYLALFAIFFPVVYLVSTTQAFKETYPFYGRPTTPGGGLREGFLLFEIVYCAQFFAIEYFFRGFMVLGLKPYLGWASVLVMLAPYCMIHYYKPLPEAMGAVGAGLILGTLSWRTETILYGWALHYGVALSMDLLALHHLGLL